MARRNNPYVTFTMLVVVLVFGWGAWHFLVEKRDSAEDVAEAPAPEEIERVRGLLEEDLSHEDCFQSLGTFTWRPGSKRYRVDVEFRDGCGKADAVRLARRVNDLVTKATKGTEAEVGVLVLGREIYHFVP